MEANLTFQYRFGPSRPRWFRIWSQFTTFSQRLTIAAFLCRCNTCEAEHFTLYVVWGEEHFVLWGHRRQTLSSGSKLEGNKWTKPKCIAKVLNFVAARWGNVMQSEKRHARRNLWCRTFYPLGPPTAKTVFRFKIEVLHFKTLKMCVLRVKAVK